MISIRSFEGEEEASPDLPDGEETNFLNLMTLREL